MQPWPRFKNSIRPMVVMAFLTPMFACGPAEHMQPGSGAPGSNAASSDVGDVGFSADVSGMPEGRIEGPGLIGFVAASTTPMGQRPAYMFLADGAGVRALGITFSIPVGTEPGTYELATADPLNPGAVPSVRVDQSEGNRTDSFQSGTVGTITLDAIPASQAEMSGAPVRGRFEFSTGDAEGRRLRAEGSFDFIGS